MAEPLSKWAIIGSATEREVASKATIRVTVVKEIKAR